MASTVHQQSAWPEVRIKGVLERAEREWLHTNGTGSYAMSTLALMHTRRYHGLLVAALDPPLDRHVIVNQVDTSLHTSGRTYRLSTHQFPGVAATPGYRRLESFAQDPLPRWSFRIGLNALQVELCLARGHSTTILAYTWHGPEAAGLTLRPLFAMRTMHELLHEHGAMIQRVSLRHGEVEMQPVMDLPAVVFGHPGVFMGSPDWWRRFEYPVDRARGAHHQEDLWTPGHFEIQLPPGETRYLAIGLGGLPPESSAELVEGARQYLQRLDPGPEYSNTYRRLCVAADQFRADEVSKPAVISGYPWLDSGTRDALISLPGLYLIRDDVNGAKRILDGVIGARKQALLTRGRTELGESSEIITADASLWLFEATDQLLKRTGTQDGFVRDNLFPVLRGIFERVCQGPREFVWLSDDGLLQNGPSPDQPLVPMTWMDSRAEGVAVTPRAGAAVELQALWYRACQVLVRIALSVSDSELAARAQQAGENLRDAFRQEFWCEETRFPYDCIGPDAAYKDSTIRPNAVMALAIAPGLFAPWQAALIIERARAKLLTPVGLRTLDPEHPDYRGDFRGLMHERRAAYHQGTCWSYLLGAFTRAAYQTDPNDFELWIELRHFIEQLVERGLVLGQVTQVASGDPPHGMGGVPAQAWSVAELLRCLNDYLET